MRQLLSVLSCLVVLLAASMAMGQAQVQAKAEFPLKDGDIWVMAGDSITAQHLHSNYFEAFCFARYPNLKFAFRNSGVGGHTIPTTLARFDYDIAAWQPTVVSVELGMNDQKGSPVDKFVANMGTMVEKIRGIKARPVIFSSSPVNSGDTIATIGPNRRLHEYAAALKVYAEKENIPFADQFHQLMDVWAKNKPRENLANSITMIKQLAADDQLVGVEHLRGFLAAQEKVADKPVSMQGDAVHPGVPGQLLMTAALLKDLGADGFVSSATVDASGKVAEAKGCKIDGVKAGEGKLEFDRLDERLPMPIPDEARAAVSLFPAVMDLSQYTLAVTGLKDGNHTLKVNNVPAATLTAKELAAGVNLTSLGPIPGQKEVSPILAQGKAILAAVAAKEDLVNQWRALSQKAHAPNAEAELKDQLGALAKKVQEADEKIREAAKPQKLHFEIAPVEGK